MKSVFRGIAVAFIAALLGCSGAPAQAGKPVLPIDVQVILQEEADGTWRVTTRATTKVALSQGAVSLKAPPAARRVRGEERWQGEMPAGGTVEVVGWYEVKLPVSPGKGDFRARFEGRINGAPVKDVALAHLPGSVEKPRSAPIRGGAEEYPSK